MRLEKQSRNKKNYIPLNCRNKASSGVYGSSFFIESGGYSNFLDEVMFLLTQIPNIIIFIYISNCDEFHPIENR